MRVAHAECACGAACPAGARQAGLAPLPPLISKGELRSWSIRKAAPVGNRGLAFQAQEWRTLGLETHTLKQVRRVQGGGGALGERRAPAARAAGLAHLYLAQAGPLLLLTEHVIPITISWP